MQWKKCIGIFALIGTIACVSPIQALAASSSEIEEQIASYMEDLEASQEKSEELQDEISERQEEVGSLYADVASLKIEKESYLEDMKTRIAYFYEEMRPQTLLSALFGAHSFAELLNRIQFQQSVYEYDAERMEEYEDLMDELGEKEDQLDTEIDDLGDLVEEQAVLQATLNATISDKNEELEEAKAEEAAAAAAAAAKAAEEAAAKEAARRAEEDAAVYALSATDTSSSSAETSSASAETASNDTASESQAAATQEEEPAAAPAETTTESQASSSSSSGYNMPSGSGVLTRSGGVNYFNGHMETWYTMREWTGDLGIPGMYIGSDGIVRDCDNYICVASDDLPKGTVVATSLGMGKVYDCGPGSGIIDIYTDWPLY